MKFTLQIHSGSFEKPLANTKEIITCFENIADKLNIDALILGWANKELDFKAIKATTKRYNTELYAWLPVFSELETVVNLKPYIMANQQKLPPYQLNEHEAFTFCCPVDPDNLETIENYLLQAFPYEYFDGVFLDRIRYPSAIHGKEALLGCHCDYCQNNTEIKTPNDIIKSQLINDGIKHLCYKFREKDLKIGIDLFAEPYNQYVGQDFELLTKDIDFFKPMYYAYTYAPAGLPFEAKALKDVGINMTYKEPTESHYQDLAKRYPDKLRLGIEWNHIKDIAETNPDQLKKDLKKLEACGIEHVVLCWNALYVPEEHIKAISELKIDE